jgi:predicted kinase
MIVGVPASGKTMLALQLAKQLVNSVYLSKDLIQSAFTRRERVSGEIYSLIQGPTFHILVEFCAVQLELGKHPIIDAPFSINHWRNDDFSDWISRFKKVANERDARLTVIRCLPPSLDELKNRIQKRGYEWDKWKLKHWKEFLEREPFDFPIRHDDVLEIISNQPVDNLADHICIRHLAGEIISDNE